MDDAEHYQQRYRAPHDLLKRQRGRRIVMDVHRSAGFVVVIAGFVSGFSALFI